MIRARDVATGRLLLPSHTGARAECPYCEGVMVAKCGEFMRWHWAHIKETCMEWEQAVRQARAAATPVQAPDGLCFNCNHYRRGCQASGAEDWAAAYLRPTDEGVARVLFSAPACPEHSRVRPLASARGRIYVAPWQMPRAD